MPTGAGQVRQVTETGRDVLSGRVTRCVLNILAHSSPDNCVSWEQLSCGVIDCGHLGKCSCQRCSFSNEPEISRFKSDCVGLNFEPLLEGLLRETALGGSSVVICQGSSLDWKGVPFASASSHPQGEVGTHLSARLSTDRRLLFSVGTWPGRGSGCSWWRRNL